MAHFFRIVFACFLLGTSNLSFAIVGTVVQDCDAAVAVKLAAVWNEHGVKYVARNIAVVSSTVCSFSVYYIDSGGVAQVTNYADRTFVCPSNSTASGSACTCNSGFSENSAHTACLSQAEAKCQSTVGQSSFVEAAGIVLAGATTCVASDGGGGCMMTMGNSVTTVTNKTTGAKTSESIGVGTGASCDPSTQELKLTLDDCPNGTKGVLNGTNVCVSYDPNTNVIQSTSTTSNSSSATGPSGAASSASSGTTVTTCSGAGSCVTTTTTTSSSNGGAATTTTDTKTESLVDYCKSNPTATACKSSQGSFSGSCGSEPACSGDAVMCAVASASFKTNCALQVSETSDEQSAYAAAKTKTGDQTTGLAGNDSVTVGPGSFDQTNLLGAESGMTDLTITVSHTTVTLPFSEINEWFPRLGALLKAVTFILCAYIVTGNKQGGSA